MYIGLNDRGLICRLPHEKMGESFFYQFKPNELPKTYKLDESISNFRGFE